MDTTDQTPLAHIIIVSYHSDADLRQCLPALATTAAGYPVTIIDNAPSDELSSWITTSYPAWSVLRNSANLGFGHANNVGARTVTAPYLVFLNPDTVPTAGWLEALLADLQNNPKVGMTTPKIVLLSEPDRLNTAGNTIHLSGLTTCRGIRSPLDAYAKTEKISAVSGACFAIRRDLYESLQGFDEQYFMYMEDTDLSLRVLLAGYDILYVPTSVIYHDYELRFANNKVFYQERNRYLMLLKIFKWRTLMLLLPALLLGEVISWGFVLLRERGSIINKLKAYQWVAANWALIQQRRNAVQCSRVVPDRDLLALVDTRLDITQFGQAALFRIVEAIIKQLSSVYRWVLLRIVRW